MLLEILSFRVKLLQNELFYSVNCTFLILNKYLWFLPHWFKMLRRNIIKLKQIENLDVFPKIDEEYKQATASGGTGTSYTLPFF